MGINLRRLLLHGALAAAPLGRARAQTATSPAAPGPAPFQRIVYGNGSTRFAVLLELNAPSFARAAQAVLAGMRGAQVRDGQGVALEVFPLSDTLDELDGVLASVSARRHVAAIGPLTRGALDALCDRGRLGVPVLALNQPDGSRIPPDNMVLFGLPIESEGRQLAHAAFDECATRVVDRRAPAALILTNASPLARRGTSAFLDAWRELGGVLSRQPFDVGAQTPGELRDLLAGSRTDVVFAAVGADVLRPLRAALPADLPVYGTSQLNAVMPGALSGLSDLEGVRVLDMPWQLQPDHPAVMSYPRQNTFVHLDFQRLYALGIDAFRVARELAANQRQFEVDGVTGWLRVDLAAQRRVERTAVLAEIRQGGTVVLPRR